MTGLTPLSAARAGRWSARHPWWALGVWLMAVAVALGAGTAIRSHRAAPLPAAAAVTRTTATTTAPAARHSAPTAPPPASAGRTAPRAARATSAATAGLPPYLPVTVALLVLLGLAGTVAAGVPPLLGLAAVGWAAALAALTRWVVPGTEAAAGLAGLIALALGFDHALAYVRRYRESYAQGYRAVSAASVAAATAGRSLVVCGGAQLLSAAALFAFGGRTARDAAAGVCLVAALAVVTVATAFPAALVLTQPTTGRPRARLLGRPVSDPHRGTLVWRRTIMPFLRNPAASFLTVCGVLMTLAVPALHSGRPVNAPGGSGVRSALLTAVLLLLALAGAAIALRSLLLAAGLVLLDLLTAAASWGVTGTLGGGPLTGTAGWAPLPVFLALAGLTLHQHALAVGRTGEGLRAGMRVADAVADGFARSALAVPAAVVALLAAGWALCAGGTVGRVAAALAVAVVLDAVAVRLVALPALVAARQPGRHGTVPGNRPRSADRQPVVSAIEDSGRQVEAVKGH